VRRDTFGTRHRRDARCDLRADAGDRLTSRPASATVPAEVGGTPGACVSACCAAS
jgi:hypothetical protein